MLHRNDSAHIPGLGDVDQDLAPRARPVGSSLSASHAPSKEGAPPTKWSAPDGEWR